MLLTSEQFYQKALEISDPLLTGAIGVDFETTGLNPYKGDRAVILGFTDTKGAKFCAYLDGSDLVQQAMETLFLNRGLRYCAHNAKFEMAFLQEQFGIELRENIWDTEVMARIEYNNHMKYGLQACAERLKPKESKYQPMLDWLKIRGNKGRHVYAPKEILEPYVEHDAWLSWRLRQRQVAVFTEWDVSGKTKIKPVVDLERAVLAPLFEIERNGLLVNVQYCREAVEYEKKCIEKAQQEFYEITSVKFVDSRKTLQPIFDAHGICYGKTALGNASFTEDALVGSAGHPVVAALLKHRRAVKRLSSYWSNFLELEHNGVIHPSIHQNKAQTGRMSISDPSAQNWSTDEDESTQYPIRRAFVAREGCVIASLDYSQMELRKGADEADDKSMITRILLGADLHQEVANMAGVPRSLAKNGRFAKQYGAGIPKIASTLGVSLAVARTISDAIDKQAEAMANYSRSLQNSCRPYGVDWLGRRFYFDRGFEYKAFNYRIQGGCAEILKFAICDIAQFLKQHARPTTFMLVPIHDELTFNIDKNDLHLLPELKNRMITAHKDRKTLGMDVGVEIGPNMYDLEKVTV